MTTVEISDGVSTVRIHVVNLLINYTKEPLVEFDIPVIYPWTQEPETRMIDGLKIKKIITITGRINRSSLSGAETVWDVYDKIVSFMEGGGCLSLRVFDSGGVRIDWGDPADETTFRAFPQKYQFSINPMDREIPDVIEVNLVFKHGLEQNQATG